MDQADVRLNNDVMNYVGIIADVPTSGSDNRTTSHKKSTSFDDGDGEDDVDDDVIIDHDDTGALLHNDTPEHDCNESSNQNLLDPHAVTIKSGLSVEKIRLIRTISMLLFYTCFGLNAGIMSPATLDLMELYSCNIAQISMVFMMKSLGLLLGSFGGGLIADRLRSKSDLLLAVSVTLFGVCNAAMPWCPNPWLAGAVMGVLGYIQGTINVVCCSLTIAEWGEKSPAPVNAIHFAYALGTLIAPPTTAPFLSKQDGRNSSGNHIGCGADSVAVYSDSSRRWLLDPMYELTNYQDHYSICDFNESVLKNGSTSDWTTQIYIPFGIHGAVGVCTGLLFLAFYCAGWKYQSSVRTTENNSSEIQRSDKKFRILMGIGLYFVYVFMVNRDVGLNSFIYYIAVKSSLKMSKTRAVILNTVFNGSWVIGRLTSTLAANFLKIHVIVFFGLVTVLIDTILLTIFGLETELAFWLLTCAFGILSAPCYPSVMAWADRYVEMDGVMVAIADIGIGTGGFLGVYLGGYLLHTTSALYLLVMDTVASALLLCTMIVLQIGGHVRGDRFHRQQSLRNGSESDIQNISTSGDSDPVLNP